VLSITAGSRRHEMAIHAALGGNSAEIRRVVLAQAVRPVATGMAARFTTVLFAGPLLRGMVFGSSPREPAAFVLTAIVLGTVTAIAGYPVFR
jgi:putative ABC transport system permease protein